jgi:hypothetical protein
MLEVAGLGYIVEFGWAAVMPLAHGLPPARIAELIHLIGAERCIMVTDAQMDWNPTPPGMMRMFIACMIQLGVGEEEIRWMIQRNPLRLAGIEN